MARLRGSMMINLINHEILGFPPCFGTFGPGGSGAIFWIDSFSESISCWDVVLTVRGCPTSQRPW